MAGHIPESFIDDLLNRVDIVDVINARTTLKKTGKNYSGLCPFHQEKTPSFSVEPDKQFYYCFGCGAAGNAIGFVMNYENLDFPEAIESIANQLGIDVPREESNFARKDREQNLGIYDLLQKAARYYQTQLRQNPEKEAAVAYLKSRGLTGEIARDFGLGYAPQGWDNLLQNLGTDDQSRQILLKSGMLIENKDNKRRPMYDRFRNRIMYPIRDNRGRVIAFGGRVLGDDKPKYLNSPETPVFHKGEELYGLYEARKKVRKLERFLIVEGYMDVIALAQNDIHYSVATLGTATSTNHLRRLFKLVPEVVFCFDGDKAGREAAWRALEQALPLMEDGRSARFLFLPDGEDPDSQVRRTGKQSFVDSITSATQLTEFFFESLSSELDMQTLEGRARMGKTALPLINKIPKGIYKQLVLDQLASITGVSTQDLSSMHDPQSAPEQRPSPPMSSNTYHERPSPSKPQQKQKGWSAAMKAVNLLLHNPAMVNEVEISEAIYEVQAQDIELLRKVIEIARNNPSGTTHELMGRLYATPLGVQLTQLLDREQITPKEGIIHEFNDILAHLLATHEKQKKSHSTLELARQKIQNRRNSENT